MITFYSYGQSEEISYNAIGGLVNQTNSVEKGNVNQLGGFLGASAFKNLSKSKINLEIQAIFLTRNVPETLRINTYKGLSYKVQLNYLVKTFPMGKDFIYLGPGIAINHPLSGNGDYNGPSFGANFKAMVPVRISDFPFYITYDFDYLTLIGLMRNGIGINFSPKFKGR
jgi:hypothetical protein